MSRGSSPRVTRRSAILAGAGALVAAGARFADAEPRVRPLADIAKSRGFLFGSNVNLYQDMLYRAPDYAALVAAQCGLFVCSRAHWTEISPSPDEHRYTVIDRAYDWAHGLGMGFRGHCLVWHEALPAWFAKLDSRKAAERALEDHVGSTCRHFAGRMQSWDVVNEALQPSAGRSDGLRRIPLVEKIGPEFLDIAFHTARANDPKAMLVYNDFNVELDTPEHQDRRQALLTMLDSFKKRGTPIDAVGLQSHLATETIGRFNERTFANFLGELAGRGLKIMLTELDVVDRSAPSDSARRDAEVAAVYRRYLDAALANRAVVAVITWTLTDRYGWIVDQDVPLTRRPDKLPPRPAPFDTDLKPKQAYTAMAEAFARAPSR